MDMRSLDTILDRVIDRYRIDPVDLLGINDGDGEYRYLMNARLSYLRTIGDVLGIAWGNRTVDGDSLRILELGAYLGPVSIALAELGFRVTAADIPEYTQNVRLQAKFQQGGVHQLACNLREYRIPADDGQFDLVVMCETLEHLNFNPLPVLAEINRVLRPGGYLYISLPNLASLVNRVKLLLGNSINNPVSDFSAQLKYDDNMIVGIHWREYTREELVTMLQMMGFSLIRHYYFTQTRSHVLAKILYALFPGVRPNQTAIAVKSFYPDGCFHFRPSTVP